MLQQTQESSRTDCMHFLHLRSSYKCLQMSNSINSRYFILEAELKVREKDFGEANQTGFSKGDPWT